MSGANLNMTGWTMVLADDSPNPVVAERTARDGGTAWLYANGTVSARDGVTYSLAPGFDSYAALDRWILEQEIASLEAAAKYGQEHPYAGVCGEDDASLDRLDALRAELALLD